MKLTAFAFAFLAATTLSAAPPDPTNCPMHAQHDPADCPMHAQHVDARHDQLVPSHMTTHHSFRLFADGGAIELRANDPNDAKSVAAIRSHLRDVAAQFAKNDFSTPAFVHGHPPAGVETMQKLHDAISFRYAEVEGGGRIRMTTTNADAVTAIHDFLHFQIDEHRTGDSGKVESSE